MRGKPFQSKLEPHFDLIREARRKRQTWQAIVQLLAAQGITTSRPAVYSFMKRRLKRRYPLGMAPDEPSPAMAPPNRAQEPEAELPNLSESLPPPSDFTADALTLPPMGKKKSKSKWTVLKPNP
jgi:DNA-binding transcriptional MocR family regulator